MGVEESRAAVHGENLNYVVTVNVGCWQGEQTKECRDEDDIKKGSYIQYKRRQVIIALN